MAISNDFAQIDFIIIISDGVESGFVTRLSPLEAVPFTDTDTDGSAAFPFGSTILTGTSASRKDERHTNFVKERHASWDSGIGAKIESGKVTSAEL